MVDRAAFPTACCGGSAVPPAWVSSLSGEDAAHYQRVVKPAQDEVEELFRQSTRELEDAMLAYAKAVFAGGTGQGAEERIRRIMSRTMAVADLLGRRRMILEVRSFGEAFPEAAFEVARVPAVSFPEAIKDIVSRRPELATVADEVAEVYQRHGFAVARSSTQNITERVQKAIGRGLREGTTEREGTQEIQQIGNWTRAYSQTVWRTNVSTAYSAGRMQQASDPELAPVIGAWQYMGPNDSDARQGRKQDNGENHVAAIGLIAGFNDPVWSFAAPPSGYNCRHSIRVMSRVKLRRMGLIVGGNVQRKEPAGFSAFKPHPNFANRPDGAIYA